jgi:hypothetical protein
MPSKNVKHLPTNSADRYRPNAALRGRKPRLRISVDKELSKPFTKSILPV